MFKLDFWQEIFSTIRQNKLRTFLTGFSVAWGIFMLIILLGSGIGLENATKGFFNRGAVNSMWINPGTTSMSYAGLKPGRQIMFTDDDHTQTKILNDEIEHITSRFYIVFNTILVYKNKTADYEIQSARPDDVFLEQMKILSGRFINKKDIEKGRKVVVISPLVRDYFFGDEDPLGKYIVANNLAFRIVGVFEDASELNHYRIYIPTTTAQNLYNGRNKINQVAVGLKEMSVAESKALEEKIRRQFAKRHKFNPQDRNAMFIFNQWQYYKGMLNTFIGIKIFIWLIGIGTIIAGVVGVTNIMIINVKERTKEIGIRKAIGATPASIIKTIMFEALLITTFFGYLGLLFGTILIELMPKVLPDIELLKDPQVNMPTAIGATILLIIAGVVAGYFPAKNAAKIKPIIALRED